MEGRKGQRLGWCGQRIPLKLRLGPGVQTAGPLPSLALPSFPSMEGCPRGALLPAGHLFSLSSSACFLRPPVIWIHMPPTLLPAVPDSQPVSSLNPQIFRVLSPGMSTPSLSLGTSALSFRPQLEPHVLSLLKMHDPPSSLLLRLPTTRRSLGVCKGAHSRHRPCSLLFRFCANPRR